MSTSSTATKKFGVPLVTGLVLDVKDVTSGKWYQAEIIESEFFKINIRYKNYNSQYNTEWVSTEKELHRLEPLGTHTTVKIEEFDANDTETQTQSQSKTKSNNNKKVLKNNNSNDEKQDSNVLNDYFEDTDSGFVVTHSKGSNKGTNNKNNNNNNKANNNNLEIIASLEAKISNLESKLQIALKNDATLNNKVTNLTKENEALKTKASKMSKEIKSLKKMINDLKNEDLGAWEEIE